MVRGYTSFVYIRHNLVSFDYRSIKPTDTIASFDALCEVQSDKASVEITSPFDGIVKELLVKEGEVAKVGAGLCVIEVEEESTETDETTSATPPPHLEQEAATLGIGTPPSKVSPQDQKPLPDAPKRRPHPLDPNVPASVPSPLLGGNNSNVLAAPSVRHLAKTKGVDLFKLVPGSGKAGRIEKRDVEAYLERLTSGAPISPPSIPDTADDAVVELGRTRWSMYKAMTKSLEIPHFG